jgi:hypothetical protein
MYIEGLTYRKLVIEIPRAVLAVTLQYARLFISDVSFYEFEFLPNSVMNGGDVNGFEVNG